jgi:hypothetical protein
MEEAEEVRILKFAMFSSLPPCNLQADIEFYQNQGLAAFLLT